MTSLSSSPTKVCVTSLISKTEISYDWIASQLLEYETAVLYHKGLRNLMLVGDEKQLAPTVFSQKVQQAGFGNSLFGRLVTDFKYPTLTLSVQYRMHPAISLFPNSEFYEGRIADGPNVLRHHKSWYANELFGPLVFFDVKGFEVQNKHTFSVHNPLEVNVIEKLIRLLHASHPRERPEIGVISGYKAQVKNLESRLDRFSESNNLFKVNEENVSADHIHIKVKSVDGFQGQEKDIIILSAVRSNLDGNLGFLNNKKRVNVAITRAKFSLWIVGNASTLKRGRGTLWKGLLQEVQSRGKMIDCKKHPHFSECVSDKKPEDALAGMSRLRL